MADVEALSQLAQAYGIEPAWHDIWGGRHDVTHETLRALLGAMHVPAATDEQVRSSLAAHRARIWAESVPPVHGACAVSELPLRLTLRLPAALDAQPLRWRLDEEHGLQHEGMCEPRALEELERTQIDGGVHVARRLALDLHPAPGYHRFTLSAGETPLGQTLLAVAPDGLLSARRSAGWRARLRPHRAALHAALRAQLGDGRLHRPAHRARAMGSARRGARRAQPAACPVPPRPGARQPVQPLQPPVSERPVPRSRADRGVPRVAPKRSGWPPPQSSSRA